MTTSISDFMTIDTISSCCGATVCNPSEERGAGICMDCKEHCDEEVLEEDPTQEEIDNVNHNPNE